AGCQVGGSASTQAHAGRGCTWSVERGLITKLRLRGQGEGRLNGTTNWDCTYWLFPEGAYVGLEGFSLSKPEGYLGGEQVMSLLETIGDARPTQTSSPQWETPWYVHQLTPNHFVASHLYRNSPLTVGYDNNPFICGKPELQGVR